MLWCVCSAATLTATYNDLEGVREVFKQHKGEIAGVILEPVVGNSGFIVPTQEFLEARVNSLYSTLTLPDSVNVSCKAKLKASLNTLSPD